MAVIIKMQSEFGDRPTLGQQVLDTHEEHLKSSPVEATELSHECGKSYLRELQNCIEKHRHVQGYYYILVLTTKLPDKFGGNRSMVHMFGAIQGPITWEPDMRPSLDCYRVNNEKDTKTLCWSLPDVEEMPKFLADPHEYDQSLIKWIREYESIQARRRASKA